MTNKEVSLYPPPMEDYWKVGDPNHEKLPVWEIEPSHHNPMWILVNALNSNPNSNLVHIIEPIIEPREKRQHATVWILPDGIGVINKVWANPEFRALSSAYNSSSYNCYPPNLSECGYWSEALKNTIEAWYLSNRLEYCRRVSREGWLGISRETLSDTSSKFYELLSKGASLPTLDLINNLVGNIVAGIKSGKA